MCRHRNEKTGISNYLSGKVDDVKELVQVCGEDSRLHIITSGALPPNPAELLKSGRLDRLIEELKRSMIISCWIIRLMA